MSSAEDSTSPVVGLGFGAEFIPLWQKHPHADCYAICQRNEDKLNAVGDYFGVGRPFHQEFTPTLLKDQEGGRAVHINSPIPDHAWMSIAALKAGKHVACTVPMATNIKPTARRSSISSKKTGLKYMMMETVVYAREYLFMKELLDAGEARQASVRPGQPSAGHGRLAQLLARPPADVVRHALRRPRCRD